MRAGLLLPACIVLSAIVHVLLVAAVAVPPTRTTAHGEAVQVDIVRADEVPDLPEVPSEAAEPLPSEPPPPPEPQAQAAEPSQPPLQPQSSQPQFSQPQSQPVEQPSSPPPQQVQSPPQQILQPWPDQPQQPAPAAPPPGSSPAEQYERLSAMLNLPGPSTGDGSGAEAETSARLSQREIAALRAHLKSCWQLPAGVAPTQRLKVVVRMSLRQNGTLSTDPQLIEAGISPVGPPLVQAAVKAIKQCAPYTMLPTVKYKEWRILDINFSPDEMTRS